LVGICVLVALERAALAWLLPSSVREGKRG
jgi:hypothetical protein